MSSVKNSLVIVESPAKCRTIEKILGKKFQVVASMGHVIDLPKSKMGIDVENGFKPEYIVLQAKRKTLTALKKACQKKEFLYLACDPDREGEAISWHLMTHLGKKMKVSRVSFHEITKAAVEEAFRHPKEIDMKLVRAQQARRVLDRIVGYSLSPLLWKKVAKGLSAGRVQSVALRILVDREKEVMAFKPQEYWGIEAQLSKAASGSEIFIALLEKKKAKKLAITNEKSAKQITQEIRQQSFIVDEVRETLKKRNPQAPFTTSKLQQEAYNRLRYQPTRTMRIAQSLYEGVDLGEGETVGLITYMRTDSVNISKSAMAEVIDFIKKNYGNDYLPEKPNVYKMRKAAQAAHEAIRPTSILRTPEKMKSFLSEEQYELYNLIWKKFAASQMKPAQMRHMSVDVKAGDYQFKATGLRVVFEGFLKVMEENDEQERKELPVLKKGETLKLLNLKEEQHFTKPPPRFTDASLVKVLEEEGIGRPSTYAPIIQTLLMRHYVERQGGSLFPTELGSLVVKLLVGHFERLMDTKFTARMEDELDRIEEGEEKFTNVMQDFYKDFSKRLKIAQDSMKTVKAVEEKTDEICDLCKAPLVIKWGRRGKFLSCSVFPQCRFSKSIPTNVDCPQCKKGLLVARRARSGKGRPFYGCSTYPACDFTCNRLPSATSPPEPPKPPEAAT
jgi:DNA topoisomerase I